MTAPAGQVDYVAANEFLNAFAQARAGGNENGLPELLTGSPGGTRIIGYTAQSIYSVYDFGLDPGAAVMVPHFQNNNGPTDLESPIANVTTDYNITGLTVALQDRNHSVRSVGMASGLGMIQRMGNSFLGAADKRREGTAGGTDNADGIDTSYCPAVAAVTPTASPSSSLPQPDTSGATSSRWFVIFYGMIWILAWT